MLYTETSTRAPRRQRPQLGPYHQDGNPLISSNSDTSTHLDVFFPIANWSPNPHHPPPPPFSCFYHPPSSLLYSPFYVLGRLPRCWQHPILSSLPSHLKFSAHSIFCSLTSPRAVDHTKWSATTAALVWGPEYSGDPLVVRIGSLVHLKSFVVSEKWVIIYFE